MNENINLTLLEYIFLGKLVILIKFKSALTVALTSVMYCWFSLMKDGMCMPLLLWIRSDLVLQFLYYYKKMNITQSDS